MQNIGAANADDAFYRYKMPKLVTKVRGRAGLLWSVCVCWLLWGAWGCILCVPFLCLLSTYTSSLPRRSLYTDGCYKPSLLHALSVRNCPWLQIEGRGNGIKTNIVNNVDIAKALERPPECKCAWLARVCPTHADFLFLHAT